MVLTQFREHLEQLVQTDGVGFVAAILLVALILLICPAPKKRRIRASVYLLAAYLVLIVAGEFSEPATKLHRFFSLAATFFLLAALFRSLFVLVVQGLFARTFASTPRIFLDVLHGLLYVAALLYTLSAAGVDPGSLLTGSALLTAVLGLSLRDTLGNLFAGLALQAERPFTVGDWIQWDTHASHIGRVTEINWRATRVVTLDAIEITVPHGKLSLESIVNFSRPKRLSRRSVYFHAPIDTPTHDVHQVVLEAIRDSFGVLSDPPASLVTFVFDDRGIQYWLRFFTTEFEKRDRVDGEVRDRIWYALNRAGISIPSPRYDVHLEKQSTHRQERDEREQMADRVQAIRGVDFLAPLQQGSHEHLATRARSARYGAGEAILRQGDAGEDFFIVRQGEVVVRLEQPGQPGINLATLGPGEFFGEMSLLTGEPRSATVLAATPCDLLVVGKAAFANILQQSPSLAEQISTIISARQANRRVKQSESLHATPEKGQDRRLLDRIKEFFSI